jgi:hypothetical protein
MTVLLRAGRSGLQVVGKAMRVRAAQARQSPMRWRIFVVAVGAMSAVGCAGPATSPIPATTMTATVGPPVRVNSRTMKAPRPTTPPPTLVRTALTVADHDATVLAQPGRPITVTLAPTNVGNWDRAKASNAAVLHLDSVTGGYPSQQALMARFSVVGRGQSDIATYTRLGCRCGPGPTLWHVRVVVR